MTGFQTTGSYCRVIWSGDDAFCRALRFPTTMRICSIPMQHHSTVPRVNAGAVRSR